MRVRMSSLLRCATTRIALTVALLSFATTVLVLVLAVVVFAVVLPSKLPLALAVVVVARVTRVAPMVVVMIALGYMLLLLAPGLLAFSFRS